MYYRMFFLSVWCTVRVYQCSQWNISNEKSFSFVSESSFWKLAKGLHNSFTDPIWKPWVWKYFTVFQMLRDSNFPRINVKHRKVIALELLLTYANLSVVVKRLLLCWFVYVSSDMIIAYAGLFNSELEVSFSISLFPKGFSIGNPLEVYICVCGTWIPYFLYQCMYLV